MKSSLISGILVFVFGCAGSPSEDPGLPIQHVGLGAVAPLGEAVQTSGVPTLGEAVSPISGFPSDAASVAVTQVGGWSSGPGAVRWHGGQWVMPYGLQPGSVLQNVSCDVWNPTTAAPATVLVEVVSSNGQVLGSSTLPASTSVVFRAWPFLGTHAVTDGEQLVVRLSAKDATTGAWTSASQDVTVIGCAVNATRAVTLTLPLAGPFVTTGSAPATLPLASSASTAIVPFMVPAGATITATRATIADNVAGPTTLKVGLMTVDGAGSGTATASGFGSPSGGTGAVQTISSVTMSAPAQTGRWYAVEVVYATGSASASIKSAEVDYVP